MPGNKTYFNLDWINPTLNPQWSTWLKPVVDSPFDAFCEKCKKRFSLGNMGVSSIKKHASGIHHQKTLKSGFSCLTLSAMFGKRETASKDSSASQINEVGVKSPNSETNNFNLNPNLTKTATLDEFLANKNVLAAELLWAIRLIVKHDSFNSCENDSRLFKKMFPDSAISKKFAMGPDKASYLINYGLSPYFDSLLKTELVKSDVFVVCFDEALNKISQKGQMDIHVCFWCESKQQVCTRYLNSAFLGKAGAENILDSFVKIINPFSLAKILQVSMDGPAVNFKFIRLLKSHMDLNEESPKILEIGSCGLHVIHGAFLAGYKETGWNVVKFLRGLYYLFKDSPSRRAEYSEISESSSFPKKFCQVRWIENAKCAERAILIFENVRKYMNEKAKLPAGNSATNVKECFKNPLMLAQLSFFKLMSEELQPFLTRFQTSEPLSPYLYSSILELTQNLMRRCVKKSLIDEAGTAKKLAAIDLNDKKNLLNISDINIGFAATKYLNKSKVSEKDKGYFKIDCRNFLVKTISKIFERSPLLFSLTRGISSLVPSLIINKPVLAQQRMDICLKHLHENNRISDIVAERAEKEFISFCEYVLKENKSSFLSFELGKQRLDTFFSKILKEEKKFENLWKVIKMLLILSHGNATVEGGFSVNKSILVENLNEESLVSQRQVHDYVCSVGGLENVEIDDTVLQAVKGSRTRWSIALENKKCKNEEMKKAVMSKKRQQEKINNLKLKKIKLSETAASELELINSEINKEESFLRDMEKL